MSVALIRPNLETAIFKIYSESLALGYLSAVLRENGIESDIIDAYLENMKLDDLVQRILEKEYKIVGFTIFNPSSFEWTSKAAKLLKKENPEIHIILGGHTPSFDYDYVLRKVPKIDSIARFEGEYVLLDLAKAIANKQDWRGIKGLAFRNNGKIISNELAPLTPNLDELPFPNRDYLPYLIRNYWEEYSVYINRGRGCYRQCGFCSVPRFYSTPSGKVLRQRSNKNLLSEIWHLVNTYHVNSFTFVDDIFTIPSKKEKLDTIALADEIRREGLKIYFSICDRIDNL